MLSLVVSTVAFFVAAFYLRRYFDDMGIPKTMVRGLVVFILATAVAYGVAFLVDLFSPAQPTLFGFGQLYDLAKPGGPTSP